MSGISQPLLTEAVLPCSGHASFLLPFVPPGTRCLRLPGTVEGHPSAGLELPPGTVLSHTMAGWQVHRRAAHPKWALLAENGQRISLSDRVP